MSTRSSTESSPLPAPPLGLGMVEAAAFFKASVWKWEAVPGLGERRRRWVRQSRARERDKREVVVAISASAARCVAWGGRR